MKYVERVISEYEVKDKSMPEFIQALKEVLLSTSVIFEKYPEYEKMAILERLCEPEKILQFKVPWMDDLGTIHVNRGFRVQFSGVLGPYKGGLRLHPSVNLGVLKFLGFEQVFKNALTTLPIGGGKGGSDFNPKGKSDNEIMRFCQSFMTELYSHIGPDVDVPAGDMGTGAREIGFLFGQYRRIKKMSERGVLTGKGLSYGGSLARKQATGYGLIYFVKEICEYHNIEMANKKAIVSGSGNVAIYACEKAQEYGINVVAMSDSKGYIIDDNINLDVVKNIKEQLRVSLSEYPTLANSGEYFEGSIYDANIKVEFILPCATQNEINETRAKQLVNNGCILVGEGANMPNDNEAIKVYLENGVIFAPGKAANAGGVATSALEMTQNSMRLSWTFEEVDEKLQQIMASIHEQCLTAMQRYDLDSKNYVASANIAGMEKVIEAMIAQGDY